jgi:hypothetical protein
MHKTPVVVLGFLLVDFSLALPGEQQWRTQEFCSGEGGGFNKFS